MTHPRPRQRRWSALKKSRQQGQALIYGIFVLMGGLAALFFLFNTGQISREKTKLVLTADAAAYSAGVMHARALNFDAYNNRALAANEVLVAQMVSLSSWAQYAKMHAQNVPSVFPECANAYSTVAGAAFKYSPEYAAMCFLTVSFAAPYIEAIADKIPPITKRLIDIVELNKKFIQAAQQMVHAPGLLEQMRGSVMQDVANTNYAGDASVSVEPIHLGQANAFLMNDDWRGFTEKRSANQRDRMAEVARIGAHSDAFTKERKWTEQALSPGPDWRCIVRNRKSEVRRRGGTDLVNFDEWKAEDTESYWGTRGSGKPWRIRCSASETPVAYGEQQVHPNGKDQDDSLLNLGGSRSDNPKAHALASSTHWEAYSGLPSHYELTAKWLKHDNPTLKFGVRVVRDQSLLRTTDSSNGQIKSDKDARINAYETTAAKQQMAAVATSEVFFERPFDARDNLYGKTLGKPHEIGGLFNPYWQVRLVYSESDVLSQQMFQGAVVPTTP